MGNDALDRRTFQPAAGRFPGAARRQRDRAGGRRARLSAIAHEPAVQRRHAASQPHGGGNRLCRSEEHTSELQSLMRISYAVFCLKKKNQKPTYENKRNK